MVQQYILVAEDENEDSIEIPSESDGTLLLTSLAAQFPGSCGLKYRNPDSGAFRGIRLSDGVLHPPEGVWGRYHYLPVFSKENKRKGEDGLDNPAAKAKRLDSSKCSDLIILGLPWKSTEDDLKKYFGQFGDLVLVQVKRDIKTGQSKGFGFIRFVNYESQRKCCAQRHMIDGRWCDVTIPNSKEGNNQMMNRKVFIGRVTEDITGEDLRNYFSKFGEVVDVYTPKPHRAFAFVSFADPETAQGLCGEDHIIKGVSVHVSSATPKSFDKGGDRKGGFRNQGGYSQQGGGYNNRGGAGAGAGPSFGAGKANGAEAGMPGGMGMNLFNHAMLAAAQTLLQNPNNWGGMAQGGQGGSGGNMGGGDHPLPSSNISLSNQGGFSGGMGAGSGGGSGAGGNYWHDNVPSPSGGHYGGGGGGGWGGSHGGRGGGGAWN